MLFASIATLQGLFLMLGNKLLLGVQTAELFGFLVLGAYCSFVFSIVVYTNVSLFGEFGKAINVVLMVLQIAGTGGSYPIQVDPLIFRILQPFFPFTYALGIIREMVAGVYLAHLIYDIFILTLIGGVFLLFGLKCKKTINEKIEHFNERFEESHLAE